MPSPPRPKDPPQLDLPLPPPEPTPAQVQALLRRWWTDNSRWQSQWRTLQALLDDPAAAHLRTCARAALVAASRRPSRRTQAHRDTR